MNIFQFPNGFSHALMREANILAAKLFQFPNGFSHTDNSCSTDSCIDIYFQFPNGFSHPDEYREWQEWEFHTFQFPNGFSLKPYIPVPLSGCVHLTL